MRRSTFVAYTAVVLLAFGWELARAHSHIESSVPANGSTVSKAPAELRLRFKDEVQLTAVAVTASGGTKHEVKVAPAKTKEAVLPVEPLPPGVYTVNWRAVSADGHVMSGKFSFTIAPPK